MSINEMERKVREMRELQTLIEEATAEVEALKDAIKAAILTSNPHRNVTDTRCFDRIMG